MYFKNNPSFPKDFLWGASSSAWQVEGATEEDGRGPSSIDLNSQRKEGYADNSIAADHYHHYKEDVALMAEAGFKSYRFSIAWPRIFPQGRGKPNPKGVEFYHNLIDELLKHDITPIATIYHYDMPLALEEEYGGFQSRKVIEDFENYCRFLFQEYGKKVKYWITLNEQNMQIVYGAWLGVSKGVENWDKEKYRINHIMNLCHAKAVNACHELVEEGKVGPVPGYVPIYPYSENPKDQIAAMNAEELTEKMWLDFYAHKEYSPFILSYFKENGIDIDMREGDEEVFETADIDFIALNCYRSNVAKDCPPDTEFQELKLNKSGVKGEFVYPKYPGLYELVENKYVDTTDWDWEIDPYAMRYMLRYVYDHYQLPMMITENGLAAHDKLSEDGKVHDDYRIEFLNDQLFQIGRAIQDGLPVISYNLWSFTDLLSTGNGMAKRYGLVYINYNDDGTGDLSRIKKDSFHWYKKVIASNGENLKNNE